MPLVHQQTTVFYFSRATDITRWWRDTVFRSIPASVQSSLATREPMASTHTRHTAWTTLRGTVVVPAVWSSIQARSAGKTLEKSAWDVCDWWHGLKSSSVLATGILSLSLNWGDTSTFIHGVRCFLSRCRTYVFFAGIIYLQRATTDYSWTVNAATMA